MAPLEDSTLSVLADLRHCSNAPEHRTVEGALSPRRQAEVLQRLAMCAELSRGVLHTPNSLCQPLSEGNTLSQDSAETVEETQDDTSEAISVVQTQFMTKEDLSRMRAEMRESGRLRLQEKARRRADVDGECPLFLSLRMRRLLEFALGLRPEPLVSRPNLVDAAFLECGVARLVANLTLHHNFPPSYVRHFLEDMVWPHANACERKLYADILVKMSVSLREDPPSGIQWEPCSGTQIHALLAPAILTNDSERLGAYGVAGQRNEEVVIQRRRGANEGPPRIWFGPVSDSASDWGVYRRSIQTALPIAKHKDEICELVLKNQVVLIQGETGCGKTTQVPQYILEAASMTRQSFGAVGDPVRIVVTQPRRIAAITVAKRVAEEMGERVGEGLVGYKIRGTTVASPKCRLLFCTTGVILRRLANEGTKHMFSPQTVTYLIVDEVHERGVDTDFMLTFLKDVQASRPNLRVILMSATMDTGCFQRYFTLWKNMRMPDGTQAAVKVFEPPTVYCPAFCHPVVEVYLDDMNRRLGREEVPEAKSPEQLRLSVSTTDNDGIDYDFMLQAIEEIERSPDGAWTFAPNQASHDGITGQATRPKDPTRGAILIFFPGLGEIQQMITTLEESSMAHKWWILPLHANLPPEEQQTCFQTTLPSGKTRKIICATNVAETSVTVPDVTVVIDTCRERRNQVDKHSNTPMLREQWCGKDSVKQRRGRAGRVQPGVCFRLLPRSHMERLADVTSPEIQRVPLENVYLQVCASGITDRPGFLAKTPDPPEESAVQYAELALRDLGALDEAEEDGLTPLGRHLAALPCHPRLGKILVLGCILGVPGPCLSICAAMSVRNPMLTTQDKVKRSTWQQARIELVAKIGTRSDHCVWAYIMQEWRFGDTKQRELCRKLGLSFERMCTSMFERKHLCEALVQVGLLPNRFLQNEWDEQDVMPDWSLVRAAVVGGLYPNIIRVEKATPRYQSNSPADKAKWLRYSMLQKHHSREESMSYPKSVNLHPNSLCFGIEQYHCPWLAYYTIQQTTKLYAYDVSEVNPFALLLFGVEPNFNEKTGEFEIGGWARFRCPSGANILPVITAARRAWLHALEQKLDDVNFDIRGSKALSACTQLLKTSGLGYRQPSPPRIDRVRLKGTKKEDEFDEFENETAYMLRKDDEKDSVTRNAWSAARIAAG